MVRALRPLVVLLVWTSVFWTASEMAHRTEPITAAETEARRARLNDPTKPTEVAQLQPPLWKGPGMAAWDGLIGVHAIRSGPLELTVTPLPESRHRFGVLFSGLERVGYRAKVLVSGSGSAVLEMRDARGENNGTAEIDLDTGNVGRTSGEVIVEAQRQPDGQTEISAVLPSSNGSIVLGLYLGAPAPGLLKFSLVGLQREEPSSIAEIESRRERLNDPTKPTDAAHLRRPIWKGPGVAAWDGLIGVHAIRSGPLELTVTPLPESRHRFGVSFSGLERVGYRAKVLVSGSGSVVLEMRDARGENNGTAEIDLDTGSLGRTTGEVKVEAQRRPDGQTEISAALPASNGYIVVGLYLLGTPATGSMRFALVGLKPTD